MSTDSPTTLAPPSSRLRVAVIIFAIVETIGTLARLSIFGDLSEYKDSGFAQWLLIAGIGIYPILAVAGLIFAIKGDLRRAIMALAAIVIVNWFMDDLPSMFMHGLEFLSGGFTGFHLFAQMIVFPLLAVVAFVLARRNERLWLALAFASLRTLSNIAAVIAFGIVVAIFGF
jgi:exosortase/archaeosortase